MARPILACVDTAAFRHNYLFAKSRAPAARAWCVIKANAYGHGLLPCAEAVRDVADGFALLDMADARKLRDAGFAQPILLLEGCFNGAELSEAAQLGLSVVVHCSAQLDEWVASDIPMALDVFLKVNTGMNRLGFDVEEVGAVLTRLRDSGKAQSITLMTHFACADSDAESVAAQWSRLCQLSSHDLAISACNSAALLRFLHTHGDWVRPGIMLYGSSPMPALQFADEIGLRPVMTLTSEIIAVQTLQPGECVGYGATFVAETEMRVGVVACGYADGYPRHAPTGTPILVEGARTRTLGRVSMDMLACDLTNLPDAQIGSSVTLWGNGLSADEVASAAGTISYELFCALAPRVPLKYLSNLDPS